MAAAVLRALPLPDTLRTQLQRIHPAKRASHTIPAPATTDPAHPAELGVSVTFEVGDRSRGSTQDVLVTRVDGTGTVYAFAGRKFLGGWQATLRRSDPAREDVVVATVTNKAPILTRSNILLTMREAGLVYEVVLKETAHWAKSYRFDDFDGREFEWGLDKHTGVFHCVAISGGACIATFAGRAATDGNAKLDVAVKYTSLLDCIVATALALEKYMA